MNKNKTSTAVGSSELVRPLVKGQKVWTTVTVNGRTQHMAEGIITETHSGYCDVDMMSLYGGAPWITQHANHTLEVA